MYIVSLLFNFNGNNKDAIQILIRESSMLYARLINSLSNACRICIYANLKTTLSIKTLFFYSFFFITDFKYCDNVTAKFSYSGSL